MSALLDQRTTLAYTAYKVKEAECAILREEVDKDRLTYIARALEAGWRWCRIGETHRAFYNRNRQKIGRTP